MKVLVFSAITAFTLTYFAIPSIIRIARVKKLFDEPNDRSSHSQRTPSLGGVAIFCGSVFSIVLWTPFQFFGNLQYILCAYIILFLVGVRDDILPMEPVKKLVAQVLAAFILVFKSDIRLQGLYGLFGLHDMGAVFSVLLSVLTIIVIINAFNLIDGINGLAGSVGAVVASTLGCWFFVIGRIEYAIVAFTLVGAIVAFLKYNFTPASIFMGDTGSLIVGLANAILIIQFIDIAYHQLPNTPYHINAIPAVAFGILVIPLFDTLRVFVVRFINRKPVFYADRSHIHHILIDMGLDHMQATGILVLVNFCFIAMVLALHPLLGVHQLLALVFVVALLLSYMAYVRAKKIKQKNSI